MASGLMAQDFRGLDWTEHPSLPPRDRMEAPSADAYPIRYGVRSFDTRFGGSGWPVASCCRACFLFDEGSTPQEREHSFYSHVPEPTEGFKRIVSDLRFDGGEEASFIVIDLNVAEDDRLSPGKPVRLFSGDPTPGGPLGPTGLYGNGGAIVRTESGLVWGSPEQSIVRR